MLASTMTKAKLNQQTYDSNQNYIVIDGVLVRLLPDCLKCGANEYHVTGTGKYLVCKCGTKYYNRGRA